MSKTDKIFELKKLLDSGLISQSDFQKFKKDVFDGSEDTSINVGKNSHSEFRRYVQSDIDSDVIHNNSKKRCPQCGSENTNENSECKICKTDFSTIESDYKSNNYTENSSKKSKYLILGLLAALSIVIGFVYYSNSNKSSNNQETDIQDAKAIIDSVKVNEESLNQKLDWIWAKGPNGRKLNSINLSNGDRNSKNLITDSQGNIYIIGDFHGETIAFDNITSESIGESDSNWNTYFTKYDKNGNVKWVKIIKEYDATCIAIDSNDDIYISCDNHFISKYNSEGEKLWEKITTMTGIRIAIKSANCLYVVGALDYPNYSILKYDSEGNVLWSKELRTIKIAGESLGLDLKVASLKTDINGDFYLCGSFGGAQLKFENTILNRKGINCKITDHGCDIESNNGFIIKFDKNGNCMWAKNLGVEDYYNNTNFSHLEVDENSNIYILVDCYSPDGGTLLNENTINKTVFLLIKYDKDGNVLWSKNIESCSNFLIGITFEALTVNKFGNVYIAGSSRCNSLSFGKYTEYANDGDLNFIAKYNPDGEVLSTKSINNSMEKKEKIKINLDDISTDKNGNLLIYGRYKDGGLKFGNSILKEQPDGTTFFLAKLKTVDNFSAELK